MSLKVGIKTGVLGLILALLLAVSAPAPEAASRARVSASQPEHRPSAGPTLRAVRTNRSVYPGGKVPRDEKFEITFQVDTIAENLQLPYSATPPTGIKAGAGISVDALFSPDHWKTVYRQPAFYYQEFAVQIKGGQEWFYPTGEFSWKVRFAPDQAGGWQFKLAAQDASGAAETPPQSFQVVESRERGFLRVSARDPRYFEFDDGTYFPGLGFNMNYDHVSWTNPVLDNEASFQAMSENGIQLVRIWLSQWGIYSSAWNPWNAIDPNLHAQYIPHTGLTFQNAYPGSDVAMKIDTASNPCMFIGAFKPRPAVKRNTTYRVRVRYRTAGIRGPRAAGSPYGFVAKTGGWLWEEKRCDQAGAGAPLTPYQASASGGWQVLEGSFAAGDQDFLPNFYLALENVTGGAAWIDTIWIEEDLGGGRYGPNILPKPWMAHHLYMEQRNSFAFDRLLDLADEYGIYLRPVILEKNEWVFNHIDSQGRPIPAVSECRDKDQGNDPEVCPGNRWFYGQGPEITKVRWLQQAWWRYLQARWGYSTQIHSWELLNEGDPESEAHYQLAQAFGQYMHRFAPNDHLVSTSTWHSFPAGDFWDSPAYPDIDFADVHEYIREGSDLYTDTALLTYARSMEVGAKQPGGAGKPVVRGEVGLANRDGGPATAALAADEQGIWLHNLIWGGINPGGLVESYWYETPHIYAQNQNGGWAYDHRPHFRVYYDFIHTIPLNNGSYQDAAAEVSNAALRAWGQKDLKNDRAHLWLQNTRHTWPRAAAGETIAPISAAVALAGFDPGRPYILEWWDTYPAPDGRQILGRETVRAGPDGKLSFSVENLQSDRAVKVWPARD